jgi:hypothetical protein
MTARNLEDETEIVWVKDPSGLDYLREYTLQTTKRKGIPQRYFNREAEIYGYTNVSKDTERIYERGNVIEKRYFMLKPKDRGGSHSKTPFKDCSPAEAVKINSIKPGEESEYLEK